MNISNVVRQEKRFRQTYSSNLGIQNYGQDNLYPQRVLIALQNSPTGSACRERYETFINGNGFKDKNLAELAVNHYGETGNDLLQLVARDLSTFGGFAIHVNYNMACEIVEMQYVPFENCRLEEEDDAGYIPFIDYHIDWSGEKTRRGNRKQVDKRNIEKMYPFNPNRDVILSQIERSGGIENYKGQIFWFSSAGRNVYPTPIYDKILTDLSTDEALGNIKYRNARNNFLPAGMLVRKKGQTVAVSPDGQPIGGNDDADRKFEETLQQFQGDMNACSILDVTINSDEDTPTWTRIEAENFDKAFTATDSSIIERIYSAFGQEVWHAVRIGKLGFSGNLISEAYEYYNSVVAKERKMIERAFSKIFHVWTRNPEIDTTIEPLVYVSNTKTEEP